MQIEPFRPRLLPTILSLSLSLHELFFSLSASFVSRTHKSAPDDLWGNGSFYPCRQAQRRSKTQSTNNREHQPGLHFHIPECCLSLSNETSERTNSDRHCTWYSTDQSPALYITFFSLYIHFYLVFFFVNIWFEVYYAWWCSFQRFQNKLKVGSPFWPNVAPSNDLSLR